VKAVDLITKVVGVLAAILGTAGYVLILGGAILWLRLQQVELPPEVPVSLASREELIATGAQAVAVWAVLVAALGALSAWIVTGKPERRRFGYLEAGLALAVTVATVRALDGDEHWMIALPAIAAFVAATGTLALWPSLDAVAAVLLPLGVGSGLAISLSYLSKGNGIATAAGATCIFGVLVLFTPALQNWRAHQERNYKALAQAEAGQQSGEEEEDGGAAEGEDQGESESEGEGVTVDPLVTAALERRVGKHRSPAVVWIGRIAVASLALIALGLVAVASQVDQDEDFHRAVVSLSNGDCLEGTYVARGKDQIALAQPDLVGTPGMRRITTIPLKEVLEVQVYGRSIPGVTLDRDKRCANHKRSILVYPPEAGGKGASSAGSQG
jgi:hypothetical protein